MLRKLFLLSNCIFLLTGCTMLKNNVNNYNSNNKDNENDIEEKAINDKNSEVERGMKDFDNLVGDFTPLN